MRKIILIVCVVFLFLPASAANMTVVYRTASNGSLYHDYYRDLIQLALEKTRSKWGDFSMEPAPPNANTLRSLSDSLSNQLPNLLVELGYSEKLLDNKNIDFVNIPIDGGIYGYRVCYVNPAIRDTIGKVIELDQLKKFIMVQGLGWPDTDILRANGFQVIEIANFTSIPKMIVAGRADLFCQAVNQIENEKDEYKSVQGFEVDNHFVLVYPMPRFFFLNKKNQALKQRMLEGIKMAYQDGSLKLLWDKHYKHI